MTDANARGGPAPRGDSGRSFDPDALRARYRAEREKRLRPDANDQYLEMKGAFARLLEEPDAGAGFERAPLTDEIEVAIVGAGFGGILAAAHLREAGVEGLRILDVASDFGGTWHWNRYPGINCDVESYVYLPLLEQTGYVPVQKYASGAEILEHSKRIARHYDLYRDACFRTRVTDLRWDEGASRWIVSTDRGDRMRARFVCLALGILNKPKLPGIPGIEAFRGHAFHTSRWDYAYTGGDADGNLSGLRGKRVGIIGTGATAVQCIPHLAEAAEHLYVFQRTPSSIDVKHNVSTDPAWARSLAPGWQKRRIENFHVLTAGGYQPEDLVNDGWTEITRKLLNLFQQQQAPDLSPEATERSMELADFEKMEQIRARVDAIVKDEATAQALKPYYRQFCKRPCFHDEYLETFNRANVTLVDTQGKGVERITQLGVVAGGREYALDCLIYASGFEVGTSYERRAGFEIRGRGGRTLADAWKDGIRTLHGIHSRGFPNCFFVMSMGQTGFTVNFTQMLDEVARHTAFVIERARAQGAGQLEVSEAAEAEWVEAVLRSSRAGEFQQTCTPSYYNNEGRPSQASRQNGFFFGQPLEYAQILERCRAEGGLQGLELSGPPVAAGARAMRGGRAGA